MPRKKPEELRSHRWYGSNDMRQFGHHSRTSQMGYSRADYLGKPIIAIINTWSDINACHAHFRQRAEEVKRGVLQAGGFPLEMPAIALAEVFQKPTTMLYRNLLALETEPSAGWHRGARIGLEGVRDLEEDHTGAGPLLVWRESSHLNVLGAYVFGLNDREENGDQLRLIVEWEF